MTIEDLQESAREASKLLKAMSNERRLLILCHLALGEKSVGELETLVDLSQSALSQHLARLRRDNLVRTRRSAQTIYYSLQGGEAAAVMKVLHDLYCAPQPDRMDVPAAEDSAAVA
ncbi:winged helix-turn-helix transcriptional regulator [Skermanella sp. TT6]|uniref:Winged helix-turn-helix transcriptional regulator n=1 Tax=Skermanella cutis TaxID=2775420 RepID=A0ABX7BAN6_9PROT|nr:metalloregulator ArsR/SmtB family transcription factor [Skermanella sp. TT6]QQP91439.1 winged helix-turn-helix transcriptional regulator [Skermanella sp. TT6]